MKKIARVLQYIVLVTITVTLLACKSTPTSESTGEYIDDSMITSKVKTALFQDKQIASSHVSVKTFKGDVQLSGFVADDKQAKRAGIIASKIAGVKTVHNSLIVKTHA